MKLGFGLMRLPVMNGDQSKIDLEEMKKLVDAFFAAGGTYFDTAYPYHQGKSESAFRETVVKRYPRDRFTITDKMPMFSVKRPEQLEEFFTEQLERCGVDYFDYYWLHALGSVNYQTAEQTNAFAFLSEKKAEGKIRHIGFSFHDSPELLDRILTEHPEAEYVQLQINYLDWEDTTIRARECYEVAHRHGKQVIVMEPVKGGALASLPERAEELLKEAEPDLSIASWGIRFAASQENVMMVLSGMSNLEQVEDNLSYMGENFQPLTEDECKLLEQAAEIIRESIAIPCTACRYCVDGCPKKIPIPDYFAIYNNLKRFQKIQAAVANAYYNNTARGRGKASDCISCGACEKSCPQHLRVIDYLKKVAETLE